MNDVFIIYIIRPYFKKNLLEKLLKVFFYSTPTILHFDETEKSGKMPSLYL